MYPTLRDEIVAIDLETTGLRWWGPDRYFGIAIATSKGEWYYDIRRDPTVIPWLRDNIPKCRLMCNHNLKFDAHFMSELLTAPKIHCTMIAEALIDEHRQSYSLDNVSKFRRLGAKVEIEWAKGDMANAPYEMMAKYASVDARLARDLCIKQLSDIRDQELAQVFDMEMDLFRVLVDIEGRGVPVDIKAAEESIPKLTVMIDSTQSEINALAGSPLNVNSGPQVKALFAPEKISETRWRLIDGTIAPSTKAGSVSLTQDVLRTMTHPVASLIMRLRKLIKARDTFVMGHVLGHQYDGIVHTSFNQTRTEFDSGTATGRLSSTSPALQQISKRDPEFAGIIRSLFIPFGDQSWLCADHSQIDFRVAAHLQNDPRVIKSYWDDPSLDYHDFTAKMMNIPRNPEYAGAPNAKQINLGLQFGAGPGKIAKTMGMPYTTQVKDGMERYIGGPEIMKLFERYHSTLPMTKQFSSRAQVIASTRGYVKTLMGRRLRYPKMMGAHKAAGHLYQANAAECHKTALIRIHNLLKGTKSSLMISVHDEIGVSLDPTEVNLIAEIKRIYCDFQSDEAPFKLRVPIECSADTGPNWYIASK